MIILFRILLYKKEDYITFLIKFNQLLTFYDILLIDNCCFHESTKLQLE